MPNLFLKFCDKTLTLLFISVIWGISKKKNNLYLDNEGKMFLFRSPYQGICRLTLLLYCPDIARPIFTLYKEMRTSLVA